LLVLSDQLPVLILAQTKPVRSPGLTKMVAQVNAKKRDRVTGWVSPRFADAPKIDQRRFVWVTERALS